MEKASVKQKDIETLNSQTTSKNIFSPKVFEDRGQLDQVEKNFKDGNIWKKNDILTETQNTEKRMTSTGQNSKDGDMLKQLEEEVQIKIENKENVQLKSTDKELTEIEKLKEENQM